MLSFTKFEVKGYAIGSFNLSWQAVPDPASEDISDFKYHVLRSNSPEGPFDRITPAGGLSAFQFEDTTVNRFSKWRRWYYKIEAVGPGPVTVFSPVFTLVVPFPTRQGLVAAEIRRNRKILLEGIGITPGTIGIRCLFYARRTFGNRCAECWDFVKRQVGNDRCLICFGTGFTGGYLPPLALYVNVGPSTEATDLDPISEREPSKIQGWTTNYPEITRGDLLITQGNRRYRVEVKKESQQLEITYRQFLSLYEIPPVDVEYLFPIDTVLLEAA